MMEHQTPNPDNKPEDLTRVSIKDVARIVGVSIATVPRCINNPERVKEQTRIKVQADGIVLLASMSPFGTSVLSSNSQRTLPIVIGCEVISRELEGFPTVHIDNTAAAQEATEYMLSRGPRKRLPRCNAESRNFHRGRLGSGR